MSDKSSTKSQVLSVYWFHARVLINPKPQRVLGTVMGETCPNHHSSSYYRNLTFHCSRYLPQTLALNPGTLQVPELQPAPKATEIEAQLLPRNDRPWDGLDAHRQSGNAMASQ